MPKITRKFIEEKTRNDIFKYYNVPEDIQGNEFILTLVNNMVWLIIELEDLKKQITDGDCVCVMEQGKQNMRIVAPEVKAYDTMNKNLNTLVKTMNDLFGVTNKEGKAKAPDSELLKFLKKGKL